MTDEQLTSLLDELHTLAKQFQRLGYSPSYPNQARSEEQKLRRAVAESCFQEAADSLNAILKKYDH